MNQEPVRNAAAVGLLVQAAVMALVTMAASFGWITVNPEQMSAVEKAVASIIALATLAAPFVAALWARARVVPVAKLPPAAQAQLQAGAPVDPAAWTDDEPLPTGYGRKDLR